MNEIYLSKGKLSALDLFCGCGGLTIGLKRAGFIVIGAVDIDQKCVQTYKANHKEVKTWTKDVRQLSVAAVKRRLKLKRGDLDLLAGCPPCQGFTPLRTLNGAKEINDPRNDLIFEFLRFIEGLRPKAVMMENVPELSRNWRFRQFQDSLTLMGYNGRFDILDAADFGVPQRRERLIYMAGYRFEIQFPKKTYKKLTVRTAISKLATAGCSGDFIHDLGEKRTVNIIEKIRLIPKDGGSRAALPDGYQLECHRRCNGFKDVYGRMKWDEPAPTITSGCFNPSKGRFLHPEEDRAITMREAALLQSLPRRYQFRGTKNKSTIASMIGNALPPPFIRRHAFQINKVLKEARNARFNIGPSFDLT